MKPRKKTPPDPKKPKLRNGVLVYVSKPSAVKSNLQIVN